MRKADHGDAPDGVPRVSEIPPTSPAPSAGLSPLARARLDELLAELLMRVGEVMDTQDRLRGLVDAVVAIGADLSLDSVLERIVRVACQLADAQYGALGVLGAGPDRRLQEFVTHGLTADQRAGIGDLPRGHGMCRGRWEAEMRDGARAHEVVVAIDGSAADSAVLDRAAEQSRVTGVPLRVVYSWQLTATQFDPASASFWTVSAADVRARATQWVRNRLGDDATNLRSDVRWALDIVEESPEPACR